MYLTFWNQYCTLVLHLILIKVERMPNMYIYIDQKGAPTQQYLYRLEFHDCQIIFMIKVTNLPNIYLIWIRVARLFNISIALHSLSFSFIVEIHEIMFEVWKSALEFTSLRLRVGYVLYALLLI